MIEKNIERVGDEFSKYKEKLSEQIPTEARLMILKEDIRNQINFIEEK